MVAASIIQLGRAEVTVPGDFPHVPELGAALQSAKD
jgi:hypothetical protein